MTQADKHKYADIVVSNLYDRSSYHEISETELQSEILCDLSPDDKNDIIRFLLSESRLCRRESRAGQFENHENTNIIILDDIGLKVATKHDGSYSKYLKSVAEKESREQWMFIWSVIAGITGVIAIILAIIQLFFHTPLFDSYNNHENNQENKRLSQLTTEQNR